MTPNSALYPQKVYPCTQPRRLSYLLPARVTAINAIFHGSVSEKWRNGRQKFNRHISHLRVTHLLKRFRLNLGILQVITELILQFFRLSVKVMYCDRGATFHCFIVWFWPKTGSQIQHSGFNNQFSLYGYLSFFEIHLIFVKRLRICRWVQIFRCHCSQGAN